MSQTPEIIYLSDPSSVSMADDWLILLILTIFGSSEDLKFFVNYFAE